MLRRASVPLLACLIALPATAQAAWVLSGPRPTPKFEALCQQMLGPTQIMVQNQTENVKLDLSKSVPQISKEADPASEHGKHSSVLGLTVTRHNYRVRVGGSVLEDPDTGQVCMRPAITTLISAGAQTIYIGKEFPQGSCAYRAILTHELTHANINENIARHVAQITQPAMARYFGQRIFYGQKDLVMEEVLQLTQQQWFPWISSQMKAASSMHAKIDTPEEYRAVTRSCNGEIQLRLDAAYRAGRH